MIAYVVGPAVALLVSLGFTQLSSNKSKQEYEALVARIEKVESNVDTLDKETLKKMLITMQPVAKAVKSLQDAIGETSV